MAARDTFKQNHGPGEPPDGGTRAKALYVHVPFCVAKCDYCDFYSQPMTRRAGEAFVAAARGELAAVAEHLASPLASIFVGGGTPTSLGADLLARLLEALRPLADGDTEFTIEANPGTLAPPVVRALRDGGVNRASLGAQSFDDAELRQLGRIHTAGEVARSVEAIRRAGVENINLDLIYGIPGQTLRSWRRTLAAAMALEPAHLSCYALSFEAGTPLERRQAGGQVRPMGEADQKQCYAAAIDAAADAGLEHYEISNFARAGRECRHNITYWMNERYVGVGPAAASYLDGVRRTNRPDLEAYLAAVLAGELPPATRERLTGRRAMAEAIMLGLRMVRGIDRAAFAGRYGQDPVEAFGRSVGRYARTGTLIVSPQRLRLAPDAFFAADTVLADILAEA